ncbi:MAG: NAD-dependent succinate-semialdehyde dehydrogenase [Planctomycetota bacterium]|nr:NAD-dependent succinate-semialdehyde dehydrogenase [Planctomycetota bacterium]
MSTAATFPVINPATGAIFDEHPVISGSEVNDRIEGAHNAFMNWRLTPFAERSRVLLAAADLLLYDRDLYAARITSEMGKPITQAQAEIEKCAWVCRYYAEQGEKLLKGEKIMIEQGEATVVPCPLGVVYAIMPWNFPFWQAFRAAAPALMAGNAMLLKGAPNVPGCSQDISSIFSKSGAPFGLFNDLPIHLSDSPAVIANPLVRGVTLTGSERAGREVAAVAGRHLKKCVLELGGSDPYLILEDADLQLAVDRCATSRMLCAGQVCIAAKRIIAVDGVYDEFRDMLVEKIKSYAMEDPDKPECLLGPLAREDLRDTVHRQVTDSVCLGADLVCGGHIPERAGWWYPPTLLENITVGMPAFDEEIFGPVVSLVRAEDTRRAIALAGNTRFGLGGGIFTKDAARGAELATYEIDAGCLAVNDFVRSDPRIPFGGTKSSGFGRELGRAGIHEFVNLKSVVVAH